MERWEELRLHTPCRDAKGLGQLCPEQLRTYRVPSPRMMGVRVTAIRVVACLPRQRIRLKDGL